jgi:hypothetical protein
VARPAPREAAPRAGSLRLLVLWDVIVANFQVARIVLFMPRKIQSAWITVPLDLTSPEAISLLAGTITMTPGTLTADTLRLRPRAPDPCAPRPRPRRRPRRHQDPLRGPAEKDFRMILPYALLFFLGA